MPLITITDNFGTKGNEIAQIVAAELDVELFDDGRLQNIVTKTGMPASAKYRFEKHAPGFWGLLHSHEPQVYLDTMEAAVYDIARNGEGGDNWVRKSDAAPRFRVCIPRASAS